MDHNDIAREQRRRERQSWMDLFEAELHVQAEFVEKVFEKLNGYSAKATIQWQRARGRTHHVAFFDWEASTDEAPWALRLHMAISFDENIREKVSIDVATRLYILLLPKYPEAMILSFLKLDTSKNIQTYRFQSSLRGASKTALMAYHGA